MQFGFDQLDELAFLAASDERNRWPTGLVANSLGAIVELKWLQDKGIVLPSFNDFNRTRRLLLFKALLEGERVVEFTDNVSSSKMIRCYWDAEEDDPDDWYYFCQSMQKAALDAGFPKQNAKELVAAARELVANIFDHSDQPESGIAGFAISNNELEIVVADQGMGVLKSLKTSDEFSSLRDSGEALQIALIDGASRFGRSSGHGGGFRALFRGLVNLSSGLRFRTGDHALDVKGFGVSARSGRVSKKAELPGFVVSISCSL